MIHENPELVKYVNYLVGSQRPETHQACFETVLGLYAILITQAQNNKCSAEFET
ncbi:MAG: hypothetical protein ABIA93_06970 [Candidatus Woesearchaeota archaeon]